MQREKLNKRLRSLRNLELFNIFFLPACMCLVFSVKGTIHRQPYVVSMLNICFILAQSVLYWHLKLQSIRQHETALPAYAYRVFSFFKRANLLILAVYPVLFVLSQVTSSVGFQVTIWSHLLYVFSMLEYVNYYHYQLSHDNLKDVRYLIRHKKIRRSPLWTDMQQHQG